MESVTPGPEDADVEDSNEEVTPEPEDSDADEANEDVAPLAPEDVDAEEANKDDVPENFNAKASKEDVAPADTVEEAIVDDDTYNEVEGGNIFGNIPSYYVYWGGFAIIVLAGAICLCTKKRDGYTEIAP